MVGRSAAYCLSREELLLSGSGVERLIIGYGVPPLIVFGVLGNCVNLTVLTSLKSRSNTLLAALALCDTAFLVFMMPHCLAHYEMFAFWNVFRRVYFTIKIHSIALLNWASAAAIWLVLLICVERLIAIRYPLNNRRYGSGINRALIAGIVGVTELLTFYNHVSYDCVTREFCNSTQLHSFCLPVDSDRHSTLLRRFVRFSPPINALFVVFVPTALVCISNVLLIWTLKQRHEFQKLVPSLKSKCSSSSSTVYRELTSLRRASVGINAAGVARDGVTNAGQRRQQMRTEQKVTLTVCAIVTCFTITQSPSAIVALTTGFVEVKSPIYHIYMRTLAAFMVVLGKSLNFVLFCLSSDNFRRRLMTILKARFSLTSPRPIRIVTITRPPSSK